MITQPNPIRDHQTKLLKILRKLDRMVKAAQRICDSPETTLELHHELQQRGIERWRLTSNTRMRFEK